MRALLLLTVAVAMAWLLLTAQAGLPSSRTDSIAPTDTAESDGVNSSSANYLIASQFIGSGGGRAQSTNYSVNASAIGEFGAGNSPLITSANYGDEIGYIGQLGGLQGPITAVSRKMHGVVGNFDISLPFSGPVGIECRSGVVAGDYQLVVTFAETVTVSSASVTSGTGTVPPGGATASGNQISVSLKGVSNVQTITVTLFGVSDGLNSADMPVSMGVLIGDTNGNGIVNSSDIGQTKSHTGEALTGSNFRSDVNANGDINSSDVALIKSKLGTALP